MITESAHIREIIFELAVEHDPVQDIGAKIDADSCKMHCILIDRTHQQFTAL